MDIWCLPTQGSHIPCYYFDFPLQLHVGQDFTGAILKDTSSLTTFEIDLSISYMVFVCVYASMYACMDQHRRQILIR